MEKQIFLKFYINSLREMSLLRAGITSYNYNTYMYLIFL